MTPQEDYINQLEATLAKFLEPIKGIPFHVAIKVLYGHEVIPLDKNDAKDAQLISDLSLVAKIAGENCTKMGIFRNRPNEVGNDIEKFVKKALMLTGFNPKTPMTGGGVRKAVGYPDIHFKDKHGRHIYLECKTYNKDTINTTMRAFYFSPAEKSQSKIVYDAPHVVISFEIKQTQRSGKRCYIPVAWKLVSIHSMNVNVKHEFNASNKDIYRKEAILAQGKIN
jgi:hypothetical protein